MKSTIRVQWSDVRDLAEAYRLLALFRASNPLLGHLQPEDMYWEVSWSGGFVPVDLDRSAEDRVSARIAAVSSVLMSCAHTPDAVGPTMRVADVPEVVRSHYLVEERNRPPSLSG